MGTYQHPRRWICLHLVSVNRMKSKFLETIFLLLVVDNLAKTICNTEFRQFFFCRTDGLGNAKAKTCIFIYLNQFN